MIPTGTQAGIKIQSVAILEIFRGAYSAHWIAPGRAHIGQAKNATFKLDVSEEMSQAEILVGKFPTEDFKQRPYIPWASFHIIVLLILPDFRWLPEFARTKGYKLYINIIMQLTYLCTTIFLMMKPMPEKPWPSGLSDHTVSSYILCTRSIRLIK